MALFTGANFPGVEYDRPVGISPPAQPAHPADAITLQMSDGTVQTVFDSLETGLKALTFLRTQGQWSCLANDDIVIVSIGAVKGLVMEQSLLLQRLLHSFMPIYQGGHVRWAARTTSLVLSTGDALSSVGACSATNPENNLGLRGFNITLFDWNYMANPPDAVSGSLLSDPTPLAYDFT
jgi:hypothetical protein